LVLLASVLIIPLVLLAYFTTPPFDRKVPMTLALVCIVAEKIWSMFHRMKSKGTSSPPDWTKAGVGVAYALVFYSAIAEFYLLRRGSGNSWAVTLGVLGYLAALSLHYWASGLLRNHEDGLVTTGPYRFVRHPIYLGACIETIALPLMLGSLGTIAFSVLLFIPLEMVRVAYEEKRFMEEIGPSYKEYMASTPAIIPGAHLFTQKQPKEW